MFCITNEMKIVLCELGKLLFVILIDEFVVYLIICSFVRLFVRSFMRMPIRYDNSYIKEGIWGSQRTNHFFYFFNIMNGY